MNIGIAGSGGIANECLAALSATTDIRCNAILVRAQSVHKGEALAEQYGIANIYTSYEDLLNDIAVDTVYIGIINSLHYKYAKQALEAGKNVICEKPFTSTAAQANKLAELAAKQRLFLFEAITLLHSPNYQELKKNLPLIGRVKTVQCDYSQYSSRYDAYLGGTVLPAFDPVFSGGALYDINIYNLHFVTGLFGLPEKTVYYANKGHNGIDVSGVVIMDYGDMKAVCCGAKDSHGQCVSVVQGEKGFLRMNGPAYTTNSIDIAVAGEPVKHMNLHAHSHYMQEELAAFNDIMARDDFETCLSWLRHSVDVMVVAEEARKSAGIKFTDEEV